jgi:homoserine dehydrogenase
MAQLNILLFGIGKIGSTFVNKYIERQEEIATQKGIKLHLGAIANSKFVFWAAEDNPSKQWIADLENYQKPYKIENLVSKFRSLYGENLIAVDATADEQLVQHYPFLIENGFHIVSANKTANVQPIDFHIGLRNLLKEKQKRFFYETHVGAGLPVLETLRRLHQSGDEVTRVRGVFSGSLSYIFNTFSEENKSFSQVLDEAEKLGLTEPDPRTDLSGKDVARKLLIIARELGIRKELSEVEVVSLLPKKLNGHITLHQFRNRKKELDAIYQSRKRALKKDEVFRYVGELDVKNKTLKVSLQAFPKEHTLGYISGTENVFEIHTKSYQPEPLVIKGSGAGLDVTSNGLLRDVLKVADFVPSVAV